ncbi:MAG: acetolactate synthase small subunit [Promethearchaeota archaeon]
MIAKSVSEYVIVLLVEDHPGVTMKIAGLFARRGHNMKSFTGAPSEQKGFSRIVIKTVVSKKQVEQIQKQMNKLIEVVKVQVLQPDKCIIRELALIKLLVKDDLTHQKILSMNEIYHGKVVDANLKQVTLEIVGDSEKIDAFLSIMRNMNVLREVSRSGNVALFRGTESIFLH